MHTCVGLRPYDAIQNPVLFSTEYIKEETKGCPNRDSPVHQWQVFGSA